MPSDCRGACACDCDAGLRRKVLTTESENDRLELENKKLLSENKVLKAKLEKLSVDRNKIIDNLVNDLKKIEKETLTNRL